MNIFPTHPFHRNSLWTFREASIDWDVDVLFLPHLFVLTSLFWHAKIHKTNIMISRLYPDEICVLVCVYLSDHKTINMRICCGVTCELTFKCYTFPVCSITDSHKYQSLFPDWNFTVAFHIVYHSEAFAFFPTVVILWTNGYSMTCSSLMHLLIWNLHIHQRPIYRWVKWQTNTNVKFRCSIVVHGKCFGRSHHAKASYTIRVEIIQYQ